MLARRSRSRQEIAIDLDGKGFTSQTIEDVIGELLERGWLDDEKLAGDIILGCQRANKGWSRIYADLSKRRIDRELIEESLSKYFDPEKECATAKYLVQKNLATCPSPPEKADIERAARRVSGRGFSPPSVASALDELVRGDTTGRKQGFLDTDSQLS